MGNDYSGKNIDDSFADVFRCAMLCERIHEVEDYLNRGEFTFAVDAWNALTGEYMTVRDMVAGEDPQCADLMMKLALEFRNNTDNTHLISGMISGMIIPTILQYLAKYSSIEIDDGKYVLQGTESGFLTVYDTEQRLHLHSTYDPMREANQLADSFKLYGHKEFHIFGAGLGYLAYQLWRKTRGMMDIYIYEVDDRTIKYGYMFGPLSVIDQGVLHIEVVDDINEYALKFSECSAEKRFVTYASYEVMIEINRCFDGMMTDSVMGYNTYMRYKDEMEMNLEYNLQLTEGFYSEIACIDEDKEWILVAAGPSLDQNIDFIRESVGKRIIIAVNRCIGRLADEGIRPDLIAVCDPTERIVRHIVGYEEFTEGIPLIADPNASCIFLKKYRGPKYLAPTSIFPKVLEMIREKKLSTWNVSGTVASLALEAVFHMGASKVYLIGVDLAYPNDIQYASNDGLAFVSPKKSFICERSNDGGQVHTDKEFVSFSKQLQEQIYAYPDVEVWNLSKHGLFIPGTRIGAWWEDGLPDKSETIEWVKRLRDDSTLDWREKYFILRQYLDSDIGLDDEAEPILKEVMGTVFEEMIATEDFGSIRLHPGHKMRIQIISDNHDVDVDLKNPPDLIINSREKLSGTELYFKGMRMPEDSELPDDADSIICKGHKLPYYQLPSGMPDTEFYLEVLQFLAKQNGISIKCDDPYSLLYRWCTKLMGE